MQKSPRALIGFTVAGALALTGLVVAPAHAAVRGAAAGTPGSGAAAKADGRRGRGTASPKPELVPGRYLVTYRAGSAVARSRAGGIAGAAARAGARPDHVYSRAMSGFSASLTDAQVAALRADPQVASVEPDQVVAVDSNQINPVWGLDRIDQARLPLNHSFNADLTGSGVAVYILDTGVRPTHTEIRGRVWTGRNFIADSGGVNPIRTADCHGHGTHVAATAGGRIYGVAKQASIVPVRVLGCDGSGTMSGVIAGLDWVAAQSHRPAVANLSLGGSYSSALNAAVASAVSAGVTVVVAGGNSGANACSYSPSSAPSAITVGATTSSDAAAGYSNYGSCLDLYAPGSSIKSAWYTSDTATATLNGTSMASPHTAGVVALLAQAHPSYTPAQLTYQLTHMATSGVLSGMLSGDPNKLLRSPHASVDRTAPTLPQIVGRVSGRTVRTWFMARDPGSGVRGYSIRWVRHGTSPSVDTTIDTTTPSAVAVLPDGLWRMDVRVVDNAGNWSRIFTGGPWAVDTAAPRVHRIWLKVGSRDRYVVRVWGTDPGWSVHHYQMVWNHSRYSARGRVYNTGSVAVSPRLSRGTWYVHVRAVDRRGRVSSWGYAGPVRTPQRFSRGSVRPNSRCPSRLHGVYGQSGNHRVYRCTTNRYSRTLRWRPV
ncbi:MAG: S8 family peptidase [Kineosporiaceae bacterium]